MRLDEERQVYKRRLSEMLLEVVQKTGQSGRELARQAQVNAGSIQGYLTAESFPTKENREKIARGVFGISLEELDAKIENRPIRRQSKVDDVCREIRLMDDAEILVVFQEISRQIVKRLGSVEVQ